MLAAITLISTYYYGLRALIVVLITVASGVLTDIICIKLRGAEVEYTDFSAAVSMGALALMLPATVPYALAAGAAAFSVITARQIFGGKGCEIFSVASVGFIFVSLSFPDSILSYTKPFETALPLASELNIETVQSLTKTLMLTETSSASFVDLALARFASPMGTGHLMVLTVCAVMLILRRSMSAITFTTALSSYLIYAYFFSPYGENGVQAIGYELISGMLMFGLIFLGGDYNTAPKTRTSRFLHGLLLSGLTILFKVVGKVENPIVYAVIIANPISIEMDRSSISFKKYYALHKRRTRLKKALNNANNSDAEVSADA